MNLEADQKTLSSAYQEYQKGLMSYAYFKVHDKSIGEDMVQEVFLKTWKYLVRGGKIELMRAFLYHILNHLIVDQYRKKKMASLDTLVENGFEPASDPSERLLNVLDGRAAVALVKFLPEKYQRVIRMRYVQELSLKEMSTLTGQTRNTLAVQLHRGLARLRKLREMKQK